MILKKKNCSSNTFYLNIHTKAFTVLKADSHCHACILKNSKNDLKTKQQNENDLYNKIDTLTLFEPATKIMIFFLNKKFVFELTKATCSIFCIKNSYLN